MFRALLGVSLLAFFFAIQHSNLNAQQYENPPYKGYRLHITNPQILKEDENFLKISVDVANTGRQLVDLKRKDIRHWIQVLFAPDLEEGQLKSLRGNIRDALFEKGFSLKPGAIKRNLHLNVSKLHLPFVPPKPTITQEDQTETQKPFSQPDEIINEKGGNDLNPPGNDLANVDDEPCPDIAFLHLSLKQEDDRFASLEYQIQNQGDGNFIISDQSDMLIIRAYISGVPQLTRGALPIGSIRFEQNQGHPKMLRPGDTLTGEIKLDVRKKTRYMKCLILQLDSDQFVKECDRTNNTSAVVLR